MPVDPDAVLPDLSNGFAVPASATVHFAQRGRLG